MSSATMTPTAVSKMRFRAQLDQRHDAQPQKQRQPMCSGDGGGFWFIGYSFVC